jgi:hypothetical protein
MRLTTRLARTFALASMLVGLTPFAAGAGRRGERGIERQIERGTRRCIREAGRDYNRCRRNARGRGDLARCRREHRQRASACSG